MSRAKYKVCLDDSGSHAGTNFLALGGFILRWDRAAGLRTAWRRVLARHQIKTFHSAHLKKRKGEFQGWTDEQEFTLISDLLPVLDNTFAPILSGIETAAYEQLRLEADERAHIGSRTRMAMRGVIFNVAQFVRDFKVHGEVHFLVDQGMPDWESLDFLRRRIAQSPTEFPFLGPVIPESVEKSEELQAADLLVTESFRHISKGVLTGRDAYGQRLGAILGRYTKDRNFSKRWSEDAATAYTDYRKKGGEL